MLGLDVQSSSMRVHSKFWLGQFGTFLAVRLCGGCVSSFGCPVGGVLRVRRLAVLRWHVCKNELWWKRYQGLGESQAGVCSDMNVLYTRKTGVLEDPE